MDALRKLGSLGRRRDEVDTASSPLKNEASAAEIPRDPVQISGKDEASPSGLTPIRVRVPEDVRSESEVKRDGDEESVGSGESFDSALERMEASSITSFEPPSPMESIDGRFQFEDGVREDLAESGLDGNFSYDDDDDDEEEEEDGSEEGESTSSSIINSEYSSSASNTEDEMDISGYGASSARTMLVSNDASKSDEEAIDEPKYKLRNVVTGEENMSGGLSVENEARGVALSSWKSELEDFYEASLEDNDVQEELAEKIIKVASEQNDEEDEEVHFPVIANELPGRITRNRTMIDSPAHLYSAVKAVDSTLPALKSESTKSITQGFVEAEEAESDVFTEGEDGYDDEDEDGDIQMDVSQATEKSGTPDESESNPSMGAGGPRLPSLPQRSSARRSAATTATGVPRPNTASSTQSAATSDASISSESSEANEIREKLQNIRIKFLRLARRLNQSPQNVVVAQVLYRLGLAESLRGGSSLNRTRAFSFDHANALAEEQEAAKYEDLDFACTILVLGKTGVGKSATINSIFDECKTVTSAYYPSTTKVHEVSGTVLGVKVRFIDTPGLLPSTADQRHNKNIMRQVKKYIKKVSPDIVLYFDRMDMQTRDSGDVPLLRTITDVFGAAVWFNATVVLTHASKAPPDGSNGTPMSYDYFVAQRSHFVQQTIRQAAGDARLQNPVSLVENHPACRINRSGQRVLPNGQPWKQQLLLLCFASKILAEANTLLKLQEASTPGKPFGQRSRVPPLPYLLSSLLQSRAQLKMPDEQHGESEDSDDDSDEEDEEEGDEYDDLPPFRPLSKQELEDLSKEQRQEYAEELADRERLFQKKQYREQIRRRRERKKQASVMSKEGPSIPGDGAEDESGQPATVAVPMPDMALPPSFDSDNPTHRYRYLETANQWLVRPVLETHGWDHDAGYDGFNVEKMFVVKEKIPASVSGQVTKDKKEAQVNFEAAASLRHGEGKVTLTGFDVQTIGKDLAYTVRAETRFNNFKRNKTTAGVTATYLNDTIAAGVKLEDRVLIGKRVKLVVNGGVLTGKGDKAYGGSLEATLRGKEYPLSRTLSTLGLSVMDWHGDLAIGGNLQSQFMVGKTMMVGRANLNNRGSGQVSIRASSSEQLQMVLIGIVPILRSLINCRFGFGGQPQQ
nr:chloroplast Toc125 [Physcomitrium patens]